MKRKKVFFFVEKTQKDLIIRGRRNTSQRKKDITEADVIIFRLQPIHYILTVKNVAYFFKVQS